MDRCWLLLFRECQPVEATAAATMARTMGISQKNRLMGRRRRSIFRVETRDLFSSRRLRRPPEIPAHVRGGPGGRGPGGDVLVEVFGIDLVQGVVGGVVPIEIVGAVL